MEKRGWVAWFTWETNETSRQEVCTTYVGRRSPSFLPKEETLRPPRSDLRSPGKISKLGRPPRSRWKLSQRLRERMTWGDQSFEELIPFFIFQGLFLYTEMLYKSHAGSAVLTFIKVRCFIQMYMKVLGVLHHLLARRPVDNLWPLLVTAVSQPEHLFFQGWLFLKQMPPSEGTR